jgi:hypothetical protein
MQSALRKLEIYARWSIGVSVGAPRREAVKACPGRASLWATFRWRFSCATPRSVMKRRACYERRLHPYARKGMITLWLTNQKTSR